MSLLVLMDVGLCEETLALIPSDLLNELMDVLVSADKLETELVELGKRVDAELEVLLERVKMAVLTKDVGELEGMEVNDNDNENVEDTGVEDSVFVPTGPIVTAVDNWCPVFPPVGATV